MQIRDEMMGEWTHYGGIWNRVVQHLYRILPRSLREENGRNDFEAFFKFGFVRNPWDRTVSLYRRNEGIRMAQKMSFEEFVHWIKYSSDTCIHPTPHVNQLDWFLDHEGVVSVDFIGKFENLSDDWKMISTRLGIDEPLQFLNVNPAGRKHYTSYYSEETQAIIAEKFSVDIEYFNYSFGE
jgi:hypothetical protein